MEGDGSNKKKTKGKQKREMKKLENEKDLYTTFSKRKDGIFKKATEIKALVDADASIVMYSPSGKPYCYGNPSIEFETAPPPSTAGQNGNDGDIYHQIVSENKRLEFQQLKGKHDAFVDEIHAEREKKKQLERDLEKKTGNDSWEISKDFQNPKDFEASLVDIQSKLKDRLSLHGEGKAATKDAGAGGSG